MDIAVCVLAGGRSSRMGCDKRELHYNGLSLLEHAFRLADAFDTKYLSLAANDPMPAIPGYEVVYDCMQFKGPVAGITSVLKVAGKPRVLFLTADMPGLNEQLIRVLLNSASNDADAVLFSESGTLRTFPLLLRTSTCSIFERALETEHLSLLRLLGETASIQVIEATDIPCFQPGWLQNINTKQDFEALIAASDDNNLSNGMTES